MSQYKQLTQEQRYHIYGLLQAGFDQKNIALKIGVDKSTISRELMRNTGHKGYRPKQAHNKALERRHGAAKHIKLTSDLIAIIEDKLIEDWSPDQISGYLNRENQVSISHERIYQHILMDKQNGGRLFKHLRHSNRKRKKRYGTQERRGTIKNRISIDKRPAVVEEKSRLGDWEIDTITGKNHKGALVTIVERKSKYTVIKRVDTKHAEKICGATIELLLSYEGKVHTITADNGKEFALHERVAKALSADVYFAHPYHSWERGLNENTNGLIRQYFPKGSSFENITDDQVMQVMDKLNSRPRKMLDYVAPFEIFLRDRKKDHSMNK